MLKRMVFTMRFVYSSSNASPIERNPQVHKKGQYVLKMGHSLHDCIQILICMFKSGM